MLFLWHTAQPSVWHFSALVYLVSGRANTESKRRMCTVLVVLLLLSVLTQYTSTTSIICVVRSDGSYVLRGMADHKVSFVVVSDHKNVTN